MNKGNQNGGSDYAGKHFILTDDINLNGNQWTPIGKLISESQQYSFQGSFDGDGHSVTGLAVGTSSIPASNFDNGLFGRVGEDGALKNLTVSGEVHGPSNSYCGILVGNSRGSIINCHTMGTVLSGSHNGGLAGGNNGSITSCSADVAVSGAHITGGLAGYNGGGIANCIGGFDPHQPLRKFPQSHKALGIFLLHFLDATFLKKGQKQLFISSKQVKYRSCCWPILAPRNPLF